MRGYCAVTLGVLLGGCATFEGYPKRIDVSDQYLEEVGPFVAPSVVRLYANEGDLRRQSALRNNIVTARIYAIDVNFHNFVRDITTQQNLGVIGADWAAIGLATAGVLTGSAGNKTTLAAISAAILGAKASIDKDIFYSKTIPAIVTEMEGQRKLVLAQIYAGLKKSSDEYTLFQALADLDRYYNAGTLNGALVGLTTGAGMKSEEGNTQIAAVLSANYSFDDPAQKLRKFWKPDGKINSENAAKWPAPGSEDTELGVLMELEVGHGEAEVHARVQA